MSQTKLIAANFSFRTNKETGLKRDSVEIQMAVPNKDGLIALLNSDDPKVVAFLEDLTASALQAHLRSNYIESNEDFNQETYEQLAAEGKVSIEALANLPKSERNILNKEQLEEFAADFTKVMVENSGLDQKRVQLAAGLFVERFKRVAGDNKVLAVLQERLGQFAEHASDELLAKHERVMTYLLERLEELQAADITADAL